MRKAFVVAGVIAAGLAVGGCGNAAEELLLASGTAGQESSETAIPSETPAPPETTPETGTPRETSGVHATPGATTPTTPVGTTATRAPQAVTAPRTAATTTPPPLPPTIAAAQEREPYRVGTPLRMTPAVLPPGYTFEECVAYREAYKAGTLPGQSDFNKDGNPGTPHPCHWTRDELLAASDGPRFNAKGEYIGPVPPGETWSMFPATPPQP